MIPITVTIIITAAACAVISWRALVVLTFASSATRRQVVWAHRGVAVAAFAAAIGALSGWRPDDLLAILAVAVAALLLLCKRKRPDRRQLR